MRTRYLEQRKIIVLETKAFNDLVTQLSGYIPAVQLDASIIARIDCLHSFATVSAENNYVRPVLDDSKS